MTAAKQVDWEHHVDVTDMVTELTRPHDHAEPYVANIGTTRYGRRHHTRVPALLDQLDQATPSGEGQDHTSAGYESRPAARLEAVDTAIWIDKEASRWVREAGHDDAGMTTADCVTRLGSLLPSMDRCHRHKPVHRDGGVVCCQWHTAETDIRRWWAQARIVAGWDSPAWRPDATCPMCDQRGGLRVRLLANVGLCVECRETWDPSTIGHLADHIRAESFTTRTAGRVQPCWCPWPTPIDRIGPLCPRCGSARCHKAVSLWLARTAA